MLRFRLFILSKCHTAPPNSLAQFSSTSDTGALPQGCLQPPANACAHYIDAPGCHCNDACSTLCHPAKIAVTAHTHTQAQLSAQW